LNFRVPIEEILEEYIFVKNNLITHRPEDGHKDWKAISLFGVSEGATNSHWEYGLRSKKDITKAGELCPRTIEWVKSLPYSRIDDIRFLVIEPGGYIAKHIDVAECNWLEPLNISITFPKGSSFIMDNEKVPYEAGASFVLNIHYEHEVINNSEDQRIHLVVHGKKRKDFYEHTISQKQ
jgi:aspartyl/asparaginyl beta-hydroxylase (cupin superfamily)